MPLSCLIADDSQDIRVAVEHLVSAIAPGAKCDAVPAKSAVEMCMNGDYSLVVIGGELGSNANALLAACKIKASSPGTPVFIHSFCSANQSDLKAAGATGYIDKCDSSQLKNVALTYLR